MSEEYLIILKKALKGIDLTEEEDRLIKWIAGWDSWTLQQFVQIIFKCRMPENTLRGTMKQKYTDDDILQGMEQKLLENKRIYNKLRDAVNSRWIPVEDKLPEEDADYLVTMVTPGYFKGHPCTNWLCWCGDDQEWTDTDGDTISELGTVIAWMPLPEPYQKEEEEEG